MRSYEYTHTVTFEETNLVGNVFYVNHLRWQGHCREMFLRDHAPGLLQQLREGLALVTLECSCQYYAELFAFDEISVRMSLGELIQNRIVVKFEYWRTNEGNPLLVARGQQRVACMRRQGEKLAPVPVPAELRDALSPYAERPLIASA